MRDERPSVQQESRWPSLKAVLIIFSLIMMWCLEVVLIACAILLQNNDRAAACGFCSFIVGGAIFALMTVICDNDFDKLK